MWDFLFDYETINRNAHEKRMDLFQKATFDPKLRTGTQIENIEGFIYIHCIVLTKRNETRSGSNNKLTKYNERKSSIISFYVL